MGDGKIKIGPGSREIIFRDKDGSYNMDGLKKINVLYGSDWSRPEEKMALRLIELLDYLEDYFGGRGIKITSGYRSPEHNQTLRDKGRLAASSSLHIDAEAVDIQMHGVPARKIYDYLIPLNCCGVGYYHGKNIHIDTGPPRFWDETTSGTEKGEPPENEHITLKTKSDIYRQGERIGLKFARVTDYPVGVREPLEIVCSGKDGAERLVTGFQPSVKNAGSDCFHIKNTVEGCQIMAATGHLRLKSGDNECSVRAYFCEPMTSKMPAYADSNPFIIKN